MSKRKFLLRISELGQAELSLNGHLTWAFDADPDAADYLGDVTVDEGNIGKLFTYLIREGYLTDREADRCWVESPWPDDDDDDDEDEDDEDELYRHRETRE